MRNTAIVGGDKMSDDLGERDKVSEQATQAARLDDAKRREQAIRVV